MKFRKQKKHSYVSASNRNILFIFKASKPVHFSALREFHISELQNDFLTCFLGFSSDIIILFEFP